MKRTVISLLMMGAVCLSGTSLVHAQTAVERGLKSINRTSAEAIVGFLAMMSCKVAKRVCTARV